MKNFIYNYWPHIAIGICTTILFGGLKGLAAGVLVNLFYVEIRRDWYMPILHNNPNKETDICHTPMEARRREEMRLVPIRYGFFRVAKESVRDILCNRCGLPIHGQILKINGKVTHYSKCGQ